ncbi:hypothetical protein FRB94_008236 [Tulasnella sp. JGI-2019a]|nr:hypothetical protein FRB94_008236 [Tulasnella sp. JGI-2019a]
MSRTLLKLATIREIFRAGQPLTLFRSSSTATDASSSIHTLVYDSQPDSARFIHFYRHSHSPQRIVARPAVVKDGVHFGRLSLTISLRDWDDKRPIPRFCPYFDPASKMLRYLQLGDGPLVSPKERPLAELLNLKCYRPLLALAHAENLIDKLPVDGLESLEFDQVLNSGYHIRAFGYPSRASWVFEPHLRFSQEKKRPRLHWFAPAGEHRPYVDCFPYIDSAGRLRIWDLDRGRDLVWSVNKGTLGRSEEKKEVGRVKSSMGVEGEDVRRKWPDFFAAAQRKGYWAGL